MAFYSYILILPCVLLSLLTMILFWLPPESAAKMQLGKEEQAILVNNDHLCCLIGEAIWLTNLPRSLLIYDLSVLCRITWVW